jgi:ribosome-binding factor A
MPELAFVLDTEQEKLARIDELLKHLGSEKVESVPED